MNLRVLLVISCLAVSGCISHSTAPSTTTTHGTTPSSSPGGIAPPPAAIKLFSQTARLGMGQAVYAQGQGFSQGLPVTGIDGQQLNCVTIDLHGAPLASLQVNATWAAQSPLVQTLRFVVGNPDRSQIEAEKTGPSPFSFTVPMSKIHPSKAGYDVSVQLSNETRDPRAEASQAVDLTVQVGVAQGTVDFGRAGCAAANS